MASCYRLPIWSILTEQEPQEHSTGRSLRLRIPACLLVGEGALSGREAHFLETQLGAPFTSIWYRKGAAKNEKVSRKKQPPKHEPPSLSLYAHTLHASLFIWAQEQIWQSHRTAPWFQPNTLAPHEPSLHQPLHCPPLDPLCPLCRDTLRCSRQQTTDHFAAETRTCDIDYFSAYLPLPPTLHPHLPPPPFPVSLSFSSSLSHAPSPPLQVTPLPAVSLREDLCAVAAVFGHQTDKTPASCIAASLRTAD